ncbi:hypothetical protein [Proteus terrae]|uniref:hypothetical protein n=1 Tax=Proteus terrae TaxID=1574161 RepID=UPI002246C0F5|nr:hypothetical protein [Proteus terrae]MCW9687979.1 hypothetical protein [Proteus terrae]
MSDKGDNCLIFVLKWSFIIILFTTVFLLGFSFIYYSKITLDSKISSFFSFISALGILATIIIYHLQKKDRKENENILMCKKIKSYKESIEYEKRKLRLLLKNLILLRKRIVKDYVEKIEIRRRNNIFTFIVHYKPWRKFSYKTYYFHIENHRLEAISKITINLIEINLGLHMEAVEIRNIYYELFSRLDNLAIVYNKNSPNEDIINNVNYFSNLNTLNVDHLYKKICDIPH